MEDDTMDMDLPFEPALPPIAHHADSDEPPAPESNEADPAQGVLFN